MTKQNIILMSDSYKYSHKFQYPRDTKAISSYIESRGGAEETVFFGLQAFIKEYLLDPITYKDIDEAEQIITAHGEPFYREDWEIIVDEFGGYLPIEIEAVPEGTVMATSNIQLQVINTDKRFFWLTSFIETALLRAIWYPSTVATFSREMKKIIKKGLETSSCIPVDDQLNLKLHDFGARGAASREAAMLGGMGHLINFIGTDTVDALVGAKRYYNENCAGVSIPASEHSTMTSWGKDNESEAYKNMLDVFGGEGKILACVSDSYDIYNAVRNIWGNELKEQVKNSGGTLVIRPDSGDPTLVPIQVIEILFEVFGFEENKKGYKVLPSYIRVIQGDGLNNDTLVELIDNLLERKISLDNIVFGMGGGLLQKHNRDSLKYAMKASAILRGDDVWEPISKDPVHKGKRSKSGRLGLMTQCGIGTCGLRTVPKSVADLHGENILQTIFRNGELLIEENFDIIRQRAEV